MNRTQQKAFQYRNEGYCVPDTEDYLIFCPDDVDLSRSPLRRGVNEPTFVLGAFNPGLARLPSGHLLLMVRVAEALQHAVSGTDLHAIRWTPEGYVLDPYPLASVDFNNHRTFPPKRDSFYLLPLT